MHSDLQHSCKLFLADQLRRVHRRRILRDPAVHPRGFVHGDRASSNDKLDDQPRLVEQLAQIPKAGDADARHSGVLFLLVSVAVSSADALDPARPDQGDRRLWRRALLHPALLLPGDVLPELRHQSNPVQSDVHEVQGGIPPALRPRPPQEEKEENVGEDWHLHHWLDQLQQQSFRLLEEAQQQQEQQRQGDFQQRRRGETGQSDASDDGR